jgi:hypothetical protein
MAGGLVSDELIGRGKAIADRLNQISGRAEVESHRFSPGAEVGTDLKKTELRLPHREQTRKTSLEEDVTVPSFLGGMVTGAWLDAQDFPPLEWSIPGVVPEGFGLLVGPPKLGKSWLVAGLGLACASGGKAFGRISVARRPVLYLALEDGHRRLQSRFRRLMCGERIPAEIHVITKAKQFEVLPMIEEFVLRHHDQKPLVILDTLGRAKAARQPGADSYQVDYAIGSRLKDAIDIAQGGTLLVVHHSRKAESADFIDAVSGTQGIAGSADFVLVLSRKRHSDDGVLAVTGRDVDENEYALTTDSGRWSLDGDTLAAASSAAEERRQQKQLGDKSLEVVALVNQRAETRAGDVQKALGIDQHTARTYLSRLAESGRIHKSGRGIYKSVASVASVAFNFGGSNATQNATPLNTQQRCDVATFESSELGVSANATLATDATPDVVEQS